jgi:hypothetical protein
MRCCSERATNRGDIRGSTQLLARKPYRVVAVVVTKGSHDPPHTLLDDVGPRETHKHPSAAPARALVH